VKVTNYRDNEKLNASEKELYQKSMSAFNGIAPTYRIALREKLVILWDFHSMMLGIQLMLSFMLVDSEKPLRACKHCHSAFMSGHPNAVFCNPRCKNQYNVYKSRGKK